MVSFSFGPQSEPTIEDMKAAIQWYIQVRKGIRVNATINMADESNELLKLQTAYHFATHWR